MKAALLAAVMAATLMGCAGGGYYSGRRAGPPPTYRGAVGVSPGVGFVWIAPYRDWQRSRWVSMPGRWAKPPRRGMVWAPGYFQQRGHRQVWVRARWR